MEASPVNWLLLMRLRGGPLPQRGRVGVGVRGVRDQLGVGAKFPHPSPPPPGEGTEL